MRIIANIELKRYMPLLFVSLLSQVYAQEPRIMLLDAIYANDSYLFRTKQARYLCKPYGVWTLDRVIKNSDITPTCKKVLDEFIVNNPKLHRFVWYVMHLEEGYRVEFKNKECIIYLGSEQTLSEALLQAGAAIGQPGFSDEEFRYRFYEALRAAKVNKRGIWSDTKLQSCMNEFFKK